MGKNPPKHHVILEEDVNVFGPLGEVVARLSARLHELEAADWQGLMLVDLGWDDPNPAIAGWRPETSAEKKKRIAKERIRAETNMQKSLQKTIGAARKLRPAARRALIANLSEEDN